MKNLGKKIPTLINSVTCVIFFSACQPLTTSGMSSSNEYRLERYNDIRTTSNYNECRKTAFSLDENASKDVSKYLASAEHFEKCDRLIQDNNQLVDKNVRLKSIAMSVQNYIKGGDMNRARLMLSHFDYISDGNDLYYPDSSSFKDNMSVILNASETRSSLKLSQRNAKSKIKDEIRRTWYWQKN